MELDITEDGSVVKMKCVFFVLVLLRENSSETVRFELEPRFSDLDLFKSFVLELESTYTRPDKCGQRCVRNPHCSVFSFNQERHMCHLFGNVVFPDIKLAGPLPKTRYYAYNKDWCPLQNRFFLFRNVNMCVKMVFEPVPYPLARHHCVEAGATLIVLEDEDRATAVITLLNNLDQSNKGFFVGADDLVTEGVFVWANGSRVTRNWWLQNEPTNSPTQNCILIRYGAMADTSCDVIRGFICQISS